MEGLQKGEFPPFLPAILPFCHPAMFLMVRLLAVDIDGTLLNSRGQIPDAHRAALDEAVAAGIEVGLVTGRSFHFTKPILALLPIPLKLIVKNAALVKPTHRAPGL